MITNNPLKMLEQEIGKVLLRMAVTLQSELRSRIATPAGPKSVKRKRSTIAGPKGSRRTIYTQPSRAGEFLHKRTGWLQAHIRYEPTTAAEAGRAGKIRVGYELSAKYGWIWERRSAQRRKGLMDLVDEMRPQLQAMALSARASG